MRVVFVRQFVHFTTNLFSATDVKHVLAELLVSDEPVVDTQVELLLAFLLERICDVVLVIPWLLPVTVPVGSSFLYVISRNREEDPIVYWTNFLFSSVPFRKKCPHGAIDDADAPSMIDILCTVLWYPYRVVRTIRCSQLHESFL